MNEKLFWREREWWLNEPTCKWSEGIWLISLMHAKEDSECITLSKKDVITNELQIIPSVVITKSKDLHPTSIIIDSDNPDLLGAIVGTYHEFNHPLRPIRPHITYPSNNSFGTTLGKELERNGYHHDDPFITIFTELLRRIDIPFNSNLPNVARSYWPE